MQNQQSNSGMDLIKSQMLTMLMMNNMNAKNNGSESGMVSTIYLLIITQFVDLIIKYLPALSSFLYLKYVSHYVNTYKDTINTVVTENNVLKTKRSSITLTIRIGDQENVIGQSLMDFVTNCKNTTHVSYKNKNFMMNQTSVVEIAPDVFAILTKSTDTELSSSSSSSSSSSTQSMPTQLLEIYSFDKTVDELRTFLDQVTQNYVLAQKNKLGNAKCYFNMVPRFAMKVMGNDGVQKKDFSRLPASMTFSMKRFSTNRKFSNLFGEDIDTIKNRVNFFINNRDWYNEKGIPYSLGLLLSGKPGTGKTSTIKCLANETRRHIFNINLNNDITKQQLENLFFNEMVQVEVGEPYCIPLDQRIYVLEDVDCQSDLVLQRSNTTTLNKSGEGDVHKIDLSFLLNLLDGVLEMPGRIVIMTSNFPDVLDTALVRPGRIDIIAKFTCCSFDTVVKMLEFFYDTSLTDDQRESIRETGEFKITPAEMSRIMFENFANIDGAIAKYKDFSGALDKQQQVDSPHDNSASEVKDATASTGGATVSTVGATASTDKFSKPYVIYPDEARNEFYQKYLDETADEFAKQFVKNDDGTISVSKDATASTVGATVSTVGATASIDEFSKPHVINPDAKFYHNYLDERFVKNKDGTISISKDATASTVDATAGTEFYQKYLDSRETADEFAKRFVKNDDGTLTDVGATVSIVGATASTEVANASTAYKILDEQILKSINMPKDELYADTAAEKSYEKLINKTNLKRLCGTIEEYEKYLPDYFNDNKHILCSPIPLECILKPSQETYSTLDTGVLSGASAYES